MGNSKSKPNRPERMPVEPAAEKVAPTAITAAPRFDPRSRATVCLRAENYTVGWICALPLELTAAEAMLEILHKPLPRAPADPNTYTYGSINSHNVVMAVLPLNGYGTANAATVATHMLRSFPNLNMNFMVGVAGGAPSPDLAGHDIRLGDLVIGDHVIQYDLGKSMPGGRFYRTSHASRLPLALRTALAQFRADSSKMTNPIPNLLSEIIEWHQTPSKFQRPELPDLLFNHTYDHN